MNHKDIVIRFFNEVYNKKNLEYVYTCFSKNYIEHREEGARSNDDAYNIVKGACNIFPDIQCEVLDIASEKDTVFVRVLFRATHKGEFFGYQATDKTIQFEAMEQFKIRDGVIIESWGTWPIYDILEQIK